MSSEDTSKEAQILSMVKRVLTDVAKDTYTKPGFRHPLSDNTILGIRDCLALIATREQELAEAAGRSMDMRPRFADQPKKTVVVPIQNIGRRGDDSGEEGDKD